MQFYSNSRVQIPASNSIVIHRFAFSVISHVPPQKYD